MKYAHQEKTFSSINDTGRINKGDKTNEFFDTKLILSSHSDQLDYNAKKITTMQTNQFFLR